MAPDVVKHVVMSDLPSVEDPVNGLIIAWQCVPTGARSTWKTRRRPFSPVSYRQLGSQAQLTGSDSIGIDIPLAYEVHSHVCGRQRHCALPALEVPCPRTHLRGPQPIITAIKQDELE
ncbi:hypothetical protein XPA_010225 [Xanthoria parietina]